MIIHKKYAQSRTAKLSMNIKNMNIKKLSNGILLVNTQFKQYIIHPEQEHYKLYHLQYLNHKGSSTDEASETTAQVERL